MSIFRGTYRELSEEEKNVIADIKDRAEELYGVIDNYAGQQSAGLMQRYYALAKTNLEEAVMWAVKGITG